jgi:hypothetical protein
LNIDWGLRRCFVMYQWNLLRSVYSETEHLQFWKTRLVQCESQWAPNRWDIGEFNWNSCFCFHLCSSFTIPYQLDFVVPFNVQVIGLNPPFGVKASLSDQFISHALIFRPRLVVLITPPQTKTYAIKPYLTNAPTLTCLQEFQK